MKILWLSNHLFTENSIAGSGTWLVTMADSLLQSNDVELFNITYGNVKKPTRVKTHRKIQQLVIPRKTKKKDGLPFKKIITAIKEFAKEANPDITHVWGTENYWGLLTSRNIIEGPTLLEIQGLISQVRNYIYSGMSLKDLVNCIGLKEILKPSLSIFADKIKYNKLSNYEIEMLEGHQYINTQSNWVRDQLMFLNLESKIFETEILLRKEFLEATKWEYLKCVKFRIFTFSSSLFSYKGLHILIEAVGLLKKLHPKVKLIIPDELKTGVRKSGFQRFIEKKIQHFHLEENVEWIGRLDANGIIENIHKANVTVFPSFIESYGVALNEALTIGAPVVASYSGAMPEMGIDKQTTLFFPSGDSEICAANINRVFIDLDLANQLSLNSYNEKQFKNNKMQGKSQFSIYKDILTKESDINSQLG